MLMMAMCLGMFACGNSNAKSNKATEEQSQKDRVEVLYFHGKQRCATCMAIEKNAKEAVEAQFADELKNGTVVFKSIDISKAENEKIAEKYEVTLSSLFIIATGFPTFATACSINKSRSSFTLCVIRRGESPVRSGRLSFVAIKD